MRIHEIYGMSDRFDVERFADRRRAVLRKAVGVNLDPGEGYRQMNAIEHLLGLMRDGRDPDAVYNAIERLPGAARMYLQKHVVRVNRDDMPNPAYSGPR